MMITSNNLAAIHVRLMQEGHVGSTSLPSVDSLKFIIAEQAGKLSDSQFIGWIERLLDVPVDARGQYATELLTVRNQTGKSPAKAIADQMRAQSPGELSVDGFGSVFSTKTPWWVWLILALALIGALAAIGFGTRVLAKMTN